MVLSPVFPHLYKWQQDKTLETFLGRPGAVSSKDSETGERLGGPGGSRAALLESRGVLCVRESGKATKADSFLTARFKLSSLCCLCVEQTLSLPCSSNSLSTSLVLGNCLALVGHSFSLSIAGPLCVKGTKT